MSLQIYSSSVNAFPVAFPPRSLPEHKIPLSQRADYHGGYDCLPMQKHGP